MIKKIAAFFNPTDIRRNDPDKAPVGKGFVSWMYYFIQPYQFTFFFHCFHMLVRRGMMMISPFFIAKITELFETGAAQEDPHTVWLWLGIFAITLVIFALSLLVVVGQKNVADLMARSMSLQSMDHMMRLSLDWHEAEGSGSKLQRVLKGRESFKRFMDYFMWLVIPYLSLVISLYISITALKAPAMFIYLFLGFVISYLIVAFYTGEWLRKRHETYNENYEGLVAQVYEFLNSIVTVKAFGMEKHLNETGVKHEMDNHKSWRPLSSIMLFRFVILNILAGAWIILIIGMGIFYVFEDKMSYSALALVGFMAVGSVWDYVEYFAREYSNLIEHYAGIKRLLVTLNEKPMVKDKTDAGTLKVSQGEISFNHVDFSYYKEKAVLQNLGLTVKGHEKVGLVGASGAGKTTLVKMLVRFYDPNSGAITIDNQNIADVSLFSLRQSIAIIPQDIALFNHPVIENIRYGRLDATDEEVIDAAKRAHADEFISVLPNGYQTLVGERGVKLSGGQRQRIAIARAILKNAPILVLDEATSALDSESEQCIQESLKDLMKDKTVIAIAHRLSTIAHLDRLIVMHEGQIVEDGTHEELLAQNGHYAKLWKMQSGGFLGAQ